MAQSTTPVQVHQAKNPLLCCYFCCLTRAWQCAGPCSFVPLHSLYLVITMCPGPGLEYELVSLTEADNRRRNLQAHRILTWAHKLTMRVEGARFSLAWGPRQRDSCRILEEEQGFELKRYGNGHCRCDGQVRWDTCTELWEGARWLSGASVPGCPLGLI